MAAVKAGPFALAGKLISVTKQGDGSIDLHLQADRPGLVSAATLTLTRDEADRMIALIVGTSGRRHNDPPTPPA